MTEKTIPVYLPESTVRKLQKAAEVTYRSVDDILLSTINAALAAPPNLPPDLADELSAMHLLSDEALREALPPTLSPDDQHRLQHLNHIGSEQTLTATEATEQATLLYAYHRSILRRAQAMAILSQRGHAVHHLLDIQEAPSSD
jgi:hypothetical protein